MGPLIGRPLEAGGKVVVGETGTTITSTEHEVPPCGSMQGTTSETRSFVLSLSRAKAFFSRTTHSNSPPHAITSTSTSIESPNPNPTHIPTNPGIVNISTEIAIAIAIDT